MPKAPTLPVDTAPAVDENVAPAPLPEPITQPRAEEIAATQMPAVTTDIAPVHTPAVERAPTDLDEPLRDHENMSVPVTVDSTALDPEAIDPFGDDANDGEGNKDGNENSHGARCLDCLALTSLLESLLFVASEPVDPSQLARTLAQPVQRIEEALVELATSYQQNKRGLRVQRLNDKVQLVTAPAAASYIELFLNLDTPTRLSGPALEALAIIAYRQPVTRAQIEAVRGVDCAGVLRSLVQRGLVADVGRAEGVGRPILYGVTELFMQHFGLMEMTELPPLEETDADRLWAATILEEQTLDRMPLTSGVTPNDGLNDGVS